MGQIGNLKIIFLPIAGRNMVMITGSVFGNLQGLIHPINFPWSKMPVALHDFLTD
jgi:hypothetical protein